MKNPKQKLYCYVDETGQDTRGNIFIVSVVITTQFQEEIAEFIKGIEKSSGKGQFKWGRAILKQRIKFISKIFNQCRNKLTICYSVYKETLEFKNSTVLTIAKSINTLENFQEHTFNIYVDGLSKKDERYYGSHLHHLGIHTKKVKGVKKDQNNPMIRLADSVCGFIRDVIEDDTGEAGIILDKAVKDKVLIKV